MGLLKGAETSVLGRVVEASFDTFISAGIVAMACGLLVQSNIYPGTV